MNAYDPVPYSLTGHPLEGRNAVRFVFIDEAGTSAGRDEICMVVVGLIVHADDELMYAEAALNEALSAVPQEFAEGYVFHAEELLNNKSYRDGWRLTDRLDLLKSVMSIPRRVGFPISFGMTRRSAGDPYGGELDLQINESQHIATFANCVSRVDNWIRDHAAHNEVATIVAENHDLAKHMTKMLRAMRKAPLVFPDDALVPRMVDLKQGYNSQRSTLRVTKIRSSVHFVGKRDDPLVWIADACAYGLKRFFSRREHGDAFADAIAGDRRNFEFSDFDADINASTISWPRPR